MYARAYARENVFLVYFFQNFFLVSHLPNITPSTPIF